MLKPIPPFPFTNTPFNVSCYKIKSQFSILLDNSKHPLFSKSALLWSQ